MRYKKRADFLHAKNANCTTVDDNSHPGVIKYHQGKMNNDLAKKLPFR